MRRLLFLFLLPLLFSCAASKNYNPNKKFSKEGLQEDYTLLRDIFEEKHPSLYWYTSRDSMNHIFDAGYEAIADSMTELQFAWKIIAPLTSAIHCGHTSFSMSKKWNHFIKKRTIPSFPLYLKVWSDTMMVVANLLDNDSLIKKGAFITSINGVKNKEMIQTMFASMVADGYSENVNYIRLSADFPFFHRNVFGLYKNYFVEYKDSTGAEQSVIIPYYAPAPDSVRKQKKEFKKRRRRLTLQQRRLRIRSLEYDTSFALMTINEFSKGNLKSFFRKSFRNLERRKVKNLIIDIRANGGGDIIKSVLLTRFLKNEPFRVADTAYAVSKTLKPFTRYISAGFFNNIGLSLVTHKKSDGKYHFGYWERHTFKPRRKNHFDGKVFVLTNGLTFSASSLFCNLVKGQQNIKLAGEETGGGWYGNSGIMIPHITLPNTKLRVRLPYFKLVQYHHVPFKGTGVIPDIPIGPSWRDVLDGTDTKVEVVKRIIKEND